MKGILYRLSLMRWLFVFIFAIAIAKGSEQPLNVYVFWSEGCPHCAKAIDFIKQQLEHEEQVQVHYLEVTTDPKNLQVFSILTKHFSIEQPGVPLTVIGGFHFSGYDDHTTTGTEMKNAIQYCQRAPCIDLVTPLLKGEKHQELQVQEPAKKSVTAPKTLKLPVFGEISPAHVSLPLLTLMLALIDGFNPCAMWTLVFLISLLVGLRDHFRMWVLGVIFIAASAGVYFLFMAAWLNLLLFFGMLLWIRLAVGCLALAGGSYYLKEYFFNPEAVCKVTSPAARQRVFAKLRALVGERSFLLAIAGIVLLAIAVNLVELICSAGIPAVYTQVLALSNLSPGQYYAYLGLYILIFMLDDLFVFFVAMKTLQVTGLTGAYVRYAHAIGGIVLICIGLMLLFKPEWLKFAV